MNTLHTTGGTTRKPRYLIWSYDYSHASSGPKALHRLCHELRLAGQDAYVGWPVTNPDWDTPHFDGPITDDVIAVYPEIVAGNPYKAKRVARWVLNVPGKLGGDKVYDPSEMVFTWDRSLVDAPLLNIPHIETDIYTDRGEPREGELVYFGKGSGNVAGTEITLEMRLDRHALADALNHATLLRCFDDFSGMVGIALLCGCPVEIVPTGQRYDPAGFREAYLALRPVFLQQLARFVEITQAAA